MPVRSKIVFSTNHPAPYMDRLFESLNSKYDLEVIYSRSETGDKEWGASLEFFPGRIASKLSYKDVRKVVSEADLIIAGGWAGGIHLKLILQALVQKRSLGIFSDAPDIENKNQLFRIIQSHLLTLIPYFFVTGEAAGDQFSAVYKVPREKILNFPYYPSFFPGRDELKRRNIQRHHLLSEKNLIKVLIANRFIERKGYDVILSALRYVADQGKIDKFEISIAGTGVLFEEYKKAILVYSSSVSFLGWISPERYKEELLSADILVHASHFEPYGLPPVEASLCGKTVVASKGVYSALDLARFSKNVHLFEQGNGLALGEALIKIAGDALKIYDHNDDFVMCNMVAPFPNLRAIADVLDEAKN